MPYWVDDTSVRRSMIASAPAPPPVLNQAEAQTGKPRMGLEDIQPTTHPLLGAFPTLQLIREGLAPRALPPDALLN